MELLPCPMCHQQTESLKVYRLPTFLLFLFFGASFRHGDIAACPPCMRGKIAKLAAINILPANLLWLVLLLPWYSIAALRTLIPGHSSGAKAPAGPGPGYRSGVEAIAPLPQGKRWHNEASLKGYFAPNTPDDIDANFVLPDGTKRVLRLRVRVLRHDGVCYRARLLETAPGQPSLHEGLEVFVRPSRSHPPMVWVPPQGVSNLGKWNAFCASCQFDVAYQPALEIARLQDPAVLPGREPSPLHAPCAACGATLALTRVENNSGYGGPKPTRTPSYPPGLGAQAEMLWLSAFGGASVISLLAIGAMASFSSENNAVSAAYLGSFLVGLALFGWRGLHWARENQKGGATPWIAAAVGAVLLPALALLFFEGVFPSL